MECTQHSYFISNQRQPYLKKANSHTRPKNQAKTKKAKPKPHHTLVQFTVKLYKCLCYHNHHNTSDTQHGVSCLVKLRHVPNTTPQAEFVKELSSASPCIFFLSAIHSHLLLSTPMLYWPKCWRSESGQSERKKQTSFSRAQFFPTKSSESWLLGWVLFPQSTGITTRGEAQVVPVLHKTVRPDCSQTLQAVGSSRHQLQWCSSPADSLKTRSNNKHHCTERYCLDDLLKSQTKHMRRRNLLLPTQLQSTIISFPLFPNAASEWELANTFHVQRWPIEYSEQYPNAFKRIPCTI